MKIVELRKLIEERNRLMKTLDSDVLTSEQSSYIESMNIAIDNELNGLGQISVRKFNEVLLGTNSSFEFLVNNQEFSNDDKLRKIYLVVRFPGDNKKYAVGSTEIRASSMLSLSQYSILLKPFLLSLLNENNFTRLKSEHPEFVNEFWNALAVIQSNKLNYHLLKKQPKTTSQNNSINKWISVIKINVNSN